MAMIEDFVESTRREETNYRIRAFDGSDGRKSLSLKPAFIKCNPDSSSEAEDPFVAPRRSTRHAAKLANYKRLVSSTGQLRRVKDTSRHGWFESTLTKVASEQYREHVQTRSPTAGLEQVDFEFPPKLAGDQRHDPKSKHSPSTELSLVLDQLHHSSTADEAASPKAVATEPKKLDSRSPEDELDLRHKFVLFLLTIAVRPAGGCLFLVLTLVNYGALLPAKLMSNGAVQMANAKKLMKGFKVRFGLAMFCLNFFRHWRDTRYGLAFARWVFLVYLLVPTCVWLTMYLLEKHHVVFSTCVALLVILY